MMQSARRSSRAQRYSLRKRAHMPARRVCASLGEGRDDALVKPPGSAPLGAALSQA